MLIMDLYKNNGTDFLMGLDDVFHSVRSIILIIEPIPDVKFAFTTFSRDESHRNSHSSSKNVKAGPSAFAARPNNSSWNSNRNNTNNNNNRKFERVSNLVCKHCNMTRHTIDRCFKLVGYPPSFKKGHVNQNNVNNVHIDDNKSDHSKSTAHTLTSDQYKRLMSLLSDTSNARKTRASIADQLLDLEAWTSYSNTIDVEDQQMIFQQLTSLLWDKY
ncbi:hypothetical protein Tco_0321808 [Tanacetum coccineum]